ncbi:2-succinyl-6-hydroxy-2,4-cyclohexadiene-1-carboxylate synthase [Haemophilus parahaemolyticus]|uniref:2-succinyl-6-hydroxy-2, 4-cyclohexadiene-1-carboxylate synthase n=1 Tax=Haemophilus parahaemolyticus TaxID=735 RepID=UPI0028E59922|nr:2-succinyl-6-hydroxy-2,4-cyclohexadiene-1-carboxylate synthase [Haemophilus parahaemolyticus]
MLASTWHSNRNDGQAVPVVFLHGLLGSQRDWQGVLTLLQNFPQFRPLTIDLPFHGKSENIACQDFVDLRAQLHQTLMTLLGNTPFFLVGYSLGGRVALDYTFHVKNPHLLGTILEGTNIGLKTEAECKARWQNDQHWANRFRTKLITQVLNDWYQQPVFAHLDACKRSILIEQRQHNSGKNIAQMLESTSLAKQQDYSDLLKTSEKNITFFIGEKDQKFRQIAIENQLSYILIANAGHNSHDENSLGFVKELVEQFKYVNNP